MSDEVKGYIAKQRPFKKELIEKLRKILLTILPDIKESMKYGVICYEELYYIVALKSGVNIGFSVLGLNEDELKLFEGTGKTMKHISITKPEDINEKQITELIKLVKKKCKPVHK